MIVKKFEAPTEVEAIQKAKNELGSQAVVLNSKKLAPKGLLKFFKKEYYEITAALEEKEYVSEINKRRPVTKKTEKTSENIDLIIDDDINTEPQISKTIKVEKKVNDLNDMLTNQFKRGVEQEKYMNFDDNSYDEDSDNANMRALKLIYNKLIESELDEKYANSIINEIDSSLKRESDVKSILAGVYQKVILRLEEPHDILNSDKTKVVFFIGPTGVGKTTTIAKIASKIKLGEHKKVAFITADTYRISAVEQLNTYAEIIDIVIKVVYTPEEMKKAIEELSKKYDYILVDTAGRSHKNTEQIDDLSAYMQQVNSVKNIDLDVVLVLSATTKYKDLLNIAKAYEFIGEYSLLFTKLDETSAYGNILNLKLFTGAKLTYFTTGQNVPDDFEKVNVQWLARQIIGGNE